MERGELPCSGSELSVLKIAASLGGGCPVSLRLLLGGFDHVNIALVAEAVLHANGTAGMVTVPAPQEYPPGVRVVAADSAVLQEGGGGGAEKPFPGSARLELVAGVALLRPDEQVFDAMLAGWASQQAARNLGFGTVEKAAGTVRAFAAHAGCSRGSGRRSWSMSGAPTCGRCGTWPARRCGTTPRRSGCCARYLTDPAYDWAAECQSRFGTHPVQVCHQWNTAVHAQERVRPGEAGVHPRRAGGVLRLRRRSGGGDPAGGPQGLVPAFRDATLFKVAYAFGLRRNESRMLDAADFSGNPRGPEFGEYGVCQVRFGKASKGSAPKRRGVLAVWPWSAEILQQWAEGRPAAARGAGQPGDVAVGAGAADRAAGHGCPVRRLPGRARAG